MKGYWGYFQNAFSHEECDSLIEEVEKNYSYTDSTIGFGEENHTDENFRRCQIAWLDAKKEKNLISDIWYYANRANRDFFNLDLQYVNELQFTKYEGDVVFPGKYNWHHDVNWMEPGNFHRKLSMSIILSDNFEGGDFEFESSVPPVPPEILTKGSILCFPSYLQHQVTPVTSGTRYSLVTWVEGPKWR